MKFLRSQIREKKKNDDNDLENLHHRWVEAINS